MTGMRERIAVFYGRELAESLLWVEGRLENVHLWGYVAHPSQSRSSTKGQFLFLGGRYVRDRSLGHALGEASEIIRRGDADVEITLESQSGKLLDAVFRPAR